MTKLARLLKKKDRGFTLIELIVVIGILAILAALAIPAIAGYLENSRNQTNEANAKMIYNAVNAYIAAEGAAPADLAALVTENYLQAVPTPPSGGGTAYDFAVTGDDVAVDLDGTVIYP